MRFSLRTMLVATAVSAVFGALIAVAVDVYLFVQVEIPDSYAIWGSAEAVIGYLDENEGSWPPSWVALAPHLDYTHARGIPIEQIEERVWIDFHFDVSRLSELDPRDGVSEFTVIGGHFSDCVWLDPNQLILDYLRSTRAPENELEKTPMSSAVKP